MVKVAEKLGAILTGTTVSTGTYILPHIQGYTFGRWHRHSFMGLEHVRWERLGERSTVEACKDAFVAIDKAQAQRVKQLNTHKRRRRRRA